MLKQSRQRITQKVQLLLTAYAVPAGTELLFYGFQIKKQFFTLTFILYSNELSSFGLWRGFSLKYVLSSYSIQKPIFYATNLIGISLSGRISNFNLRKPYFCVIFGWFWRLYFFMEFKFLEWFLFFAFFTFFAIFSNFFTFFHHFPIFNGRISERMLSKNGFSYIMEMETKFIAYYPLFLLIFSQFPCHFLTIRNKTNRFARKV